MSKYFLLTLSGTTPGPFDIYLDSVSTGNLLLSNVDSGSLLGGYMITTPDSSSYVILKNKANGCDNTYTVSIIDASPTPTKTPTATQTPSITPTITPSLTKTPSLTPSITQTPTATTSISVTPTATPTITISPSKTPTPTVTRTPTPSPQRVPTCVAMTGSFGASNVSCYIDGQEQIQTAYSNVDFMILKDQYGAPINSPVTLTIIANYAGGGYTFTIPSGSSTSDTYSYQSLSINYDCSENTITFTGIIETSPIYYPLC